MATLYTAFLVRCWWLGEGAQRYEVQHVYSGERVLVTTIAAVTEWMRERSGPERAAGPVSPWPPETPFDDQGSAGATGRGGARPP